MLKKIKYACLLWSFFITFIHASVLCQTHHCVAIVDAGSTGSRLHIYAYDLDAHHYPTNITPIWSKKVKPGFATIESSNATVDTYLANLFDGAPEQNIPVYFYATAGMRLVSAPKQQLYYDAVNHWFATHTQFNLVIAKTITGREEGILGWLAVNYTIGALQSADKPLAGVMDMGGASVQVTFPAPALEHSQSKDVMYVDIYDRHITLFTHSFLGLGQTQMSNQYLNDAACFSNGYRLPNGEDGVGDAVRCQGHVSKLVNEVHQVNEIVYPTLVNSNVSTWYVISGLSTLVKNEPFNFPDEQFTSQTLLTTADNQLCQPLWQTLLEQYPMNEYIYSNCLTASYYYALLVNGYGLAANQPIHYLPDSKDVDWTVGVLLQNKQSR